MFIQDAIGVAIVLVACAAPVIIIGVVYYLKKRLEHKQILVAIEKGTPLSELVPLKSTPAGPAWIGYVSKGILGLVIAFGFWVRPSHTSLIGCVIGGVGAAWLVRGLLHRKYYLEGQTDSGEDSEAKAAS
jgi:hypothetical protein